MVIVAGNTKGGVGTSTIACNLAVMSAIRDKKTLLIDADVQGSSMAFRALREKDDITAMAITTPTIHKDITKFNEFEALIIDAGGRDSSVFGSALLACDVFIIPILPSQYDVWATENTMAILNEARRHKELPAYFLLNQVIPNTIVGKDTRRALKEMCEKNDIQLLSTMLYSRVAYKNSIVYGKGVVEYQPNCKASEEMTGLYQEIVNMGG